MPLVELRGKKTLKLKVFLNLGEIPVKAEIFQSLLNT